MKSRMIQPTELLKPVIAVALLGSLLLAGCATLQYHRFKQHAERGDDRWIADQVIDCTAGRDVCGQLHLIKGAACLRLARSSQASIERYRCAADELAQGLRGNQSWSPPFVHQQFQEYLCESLVGLQDGQSGEAAAETLERLMEAAKGLYRLAPESIPAIYYLSQARLRLVQLKLPEMAVYDRLPICNRLTRTLMTVLTTMETAKTAEREDWQRYARNYERLAFELGSAVAAANCR